MKFLIGAFLLNFAFVSLVVAQSPKISAVFDVEKRFTINQELTKKIIKTLTGDASQILGLSYDELREKRDKVNKGMYALYRFDLNRFGTVSGRAVTPIQKYTASVIGENCDCDSVVSKTDYVLNKVVSFGAGPGELRLLRDIYYQVMRDQDPSLSREDARDQLNKLGKLELRGLLREVCAKSDRSQSVAQMNNSANSRVNLLKYVLLKSRRSKGVASSVPRKIDLFQGKQTYPTNSVSKASRDTTVLAKLTFLENIRISSEEYPVPGWLKLKVDGLDRCKVSLEKYYPLGLIGSVIKSELLDAQIHSLGNGNPGWGLADKALEKGDLFYFTKGSEFELHLKSAAVGKNIYDMRRGRFKVATLTCRPNREDESMAPYEVLGASDKVEVVFDHGDSTHSRGDSEKALSRI